MNNPDNFQQIDCSSEKPSSGIEFFEETVTESDDQKNTKKQIDKNSGYSQSKPTPSREQLEEMRRRIRMAFQRSNPFKQFGNSGVRKTSVKSKPEPEPKKRKRRFIRRRRLPRRYVLPAAFMTKEQASVL